MKKIMIFTSVTCAPCKTMKPILQKLADERGFQLENIDMSLDNIKLFKVYNVTTVPTVICFNDGNVVGRFFGATKPADIEAYLDKW